MTEKLDEEPAADNLSKPEIQEDEVIIPLEAVVVMNAESNTPEIEKLSTKQPEFSKKRKGKIEDTIKAQEKAKEFIENAITDNLSNKRVKFNAIVE